MTNTGEDTVFSPFDNPHQLEPSCLSRL